MRDALSWPGPALAAHVPAIACRYGIECRVARAPGVVLTFDDGPHPEGTPAILAQLAQRHARATFFLVGEQVRLYPDVARAVVEAGHEVAVHGDRHTLLLRRRASAVADDYDRAFTTIVEATDVEPTLYRPPYGVFSASALREVRRRAWRPLLWSRWGRDWERGAIPARIAARASRRLGAGDVVLLHDSDAYSSEGSWSRTAAALPMVLDAIGALGLSAVSVNQAT